MPITYTTPVTLADYTTQQRMGFNLWKENGKCKPIHQRKNNSLIVDIKQLITDKSKRYRNVSLFVLSTRMDIDIFSEICYNYYIWR